MKEALEQFLFEAADWVPCKVLAARFAIAERAFRADGERNGLLEEFAVSGEQGFKHIRHCTRDELRQARHRIRRHWLSELRKERRLQQAVARHKVCTITPDGQPFTQDPTGQGVLL